MPGRLLSSGVCPVKNLPVLALIVGLVSAVSFIAIASAVGGYGSATRKVVIADAVAAILLAVGLFAEWHRILRES